MSSTELTTGTQFKDVMRERIMAAFMDLIPKEKIDEMVDKEINAFFECDQLLTVSVTQVVVDNPAYEPSKGYGYNNEKQIKKEAIAFGSKMTPFRQMVWSLLHQHLQPKLQEILSAEDSKAKVELEKWLATTATPIITDNYQSMFTQLSTQMSNAMLNRAMSNAISTANFNLVEALRSVGLNPGPGFNPVILPPPGSGA